MSRQYGVGGGTIGTTTIEYDDHGSSSALGFFPAGAQNGIYIAGAEDLESNILKNGRVRSVNPRSQFSQRMHKTIDDNMIFNKVISGRKHYAPQGGGGKEEDESIDHRMRIFEDEIIKRIKII